MMGYTMRNFKKGLVVIVLLTLFSPLEISPKVLGEAFLRSAQSFFYPAHTIFYRLCI